VVWDTYAQGSDDERTLRANERAFAAIWLRPRVLVDVSKCDTTTTALGEPIAFPALVAPMSLQAMIHPEGEAAMARGAREAGSLLVASTLSSLSLEAIARASGAGPRWFQLYLYPDERFNLALLRRVEDAGYSALVLTVDAGYIGHRERDLRNSFAPDPRFTFGNFAPEDGVSWDTRGARLPLTWETVAWLRERTPLPLALKGILTTEDARRAVDAGVDAVIVSNHGGRQLDGSLPPMMALPEVVATVAGHCEVYVDGGVRRGTDILRALALGARAVLIGRPAMWGLAVSGVEGVRDVLRLFHDELTLAMRLTGRRAVAEVDRTVVKEVLWDGGAE
jgi:isopentenyl diphosphate isomerase/L-lactate dehydrogenase-like FMN-dependent dehydrogenase